MLLVDRVDHAVDLVTVVAHHRQAQAKHPNLLLLGHVEHQLVGHGLRLVDLSDIGQRRRVSNAKSELSPWDSRLQVTSRGYMLGYNDLKDPSVSGFFRFLAKVGDNGMKMQIVKIGFGGRK